MAKIIRYPVLHHCLKFCRTVTPDAFVGIIDVGVRHGTDFLMDVFPDAFHYLFEPVVDCYPKIHEVYTKRSIKYSLFELALTNVTQQLYLHQYSSDGSGRITHSEVKHQPVSDSATIHSVVPIKGVRLDNVVFEPLLNPLSYMIKLDVDGIEELIIEGGENIIRNASYVVLEASVVRGNVLTRLQIMAAHGFRLFDICDNAYYFNQLSCMDLVFVNEKLRSMEIKLRPWEYAKWKVLWEKWQQGYPELAKQPLPNVF